MHMNELFWFVDKHRTCLHSVHLLKTKTLTPPKMYRAHVYFGDPGWPMYSSNAFHECWDDALDDAIQVALIDLRRVFYFAGIDVPVESDFVPHEVVFTRLYKKSIKNGSR